MSTRRSLLIAGHILIAGALTPAFAALPGDPAADFIRALGNQALRVILGDYLLQQKLEYFRLMLRQDFDMTGIARFALGPYWRVASEPERREFQQLLEDYIVVSYGRRLAQSGGNTLRVTGSYKLPDDEVIVTSEILRESGGPPTRLDWRLSVHEGVYKIDDLSINGVSMALAQRTKFIAAIQRIGGRIEGLIAMMRQALRTDSSLQAPALPSIPY